MTVEELETKLAQLILDGNGNALVLTEGCDCIGPAKDVEVVTARPRTITITRDFE